jgi:hypothetical protein
MDQGRDDWRRAWADHQAALVALQADPEAWVEYQGARAAWDHVRRDGRDGSSFAILAGLDDRPGRTGEGPRDAQ